MQMPEPEEVRYSRVNKGLRVYKVLGSRGLGVKGLGV